METVKAHGTVSEGQPGQPSTLAVADIQRFWSRGQLGRVSAELGKVLRDFKASGRLTHADSQAAVLSLQLCHCHLVQKQFGAAAGVLRELNAGVSVRLVEQPWFERLYALYLAVFCLGQAQWDLALFIAIHINAQDLDMGPIQDSTHDATDSKHLWGETGRILMTLGQGVVRWHPEVIAPVRVMTTEQVQTRLLKLLMSDEVSDPNARPTPNLTIDPRQILQVSFQGANSCPRSPPHASRVCVALKLKKYPLAIAHLSPMLALDDPAQVGPVHYMIGHCHEAQSDWDLGKLAYQSCFQICPGLAALGLARIAWAKSEYEESHAILMKNVVFNEADTTMCQWPEKLKDLFPESDPEIFQQRVKALLTQLEEALEKERQRVSCASPQCLRRMKNNRAGGTRLDIDIILDHVVIDCSQGCSLAYHPECAPSDLSPSFSCPSQLNDCSGEMKAFWIRPEGCDKLPELKEAYVTGRESAGARQGDTPMEKVPETDADTPAVIPKRSKKKLTVANSLGDVTKTKLVTPRGFNDQLAFYKKEPKPMPITHILAQKNVIQIDNLITSSDKLGVSIQEHLEIKTSRLPENPLLASSDFLGNDYKSEKEMTYYLYQSLKRSNQLLAKMQEQSRKEHILLTDVLSAFELCTEAIANRQVFNRGTFDKLGRFSSVLHGHCAGIFPGYANIMEERKRQLREVLGLRPEDQITVDPNIPPPLLPNNCVISTPDHAVDDVQAVGTSIEMPKKLIFSNENNSAALSQALSQDSETDRLLRRFPDMDRGELSMLVDETRQFHGESLTDEALFEAIEEFRRVEGFPILAPMESNTAGRGLEEKNSSKGAIAKTKTLVDVSDDDIFVELLQNMSASGTQAPMEDLWVDDCTVCLEPLGITHLETLKPCGHRFHGKCIRNWLSQQRDCPLCRNHILLDEDFPKL